MNYEQIKTDSPNSWKQFIEWDYKRWGNTPMFGKENIEEFEKIVYSNKTNVNRYLYDFFDENGLFVLLNPDYNMGERKLNWTIGYWEEIDGKQYMFTKNQEGGYDTRNEAEQSVFYKAFEILEQQLNNNKL
jgi:hypothetical protein